MRLCRFQGQRDRAEFHFHKMKGFQKMLCSNFGTLWFFQRGGSCIQRMEIFIAIAVFHLG